MSSFLCTKSFIQHNSDKLKYVMLSAANGVITQRFFSKWKQIKKGSLSITVFTLFSISPNKMELLSALNISSADLQFYVKPKNRGT